MSMTAENRAMPPQPPHMPGENTSPAEFEDVEQPSPVDETTVTSEDDTESPAATSVPRHMRSHDSAPEEWPEWLRASRPDNSPAMAAIWKAYGSAGLYKREGIKPPPHWGSLEQTIAENRRFVYDSMAEIAGCTFCFFSMKGGALKTTLSTWIASYCATIVKGITLLVDADTNELQGAARRFETYSEAPQPFGFPRVADTILATGKSPTPAEIMSFAQMHYQSGAYIMTMDDTTHYSAYQLEFIAKALAPMTSATFFDTSPGSKEENTLGIVRASTVVGITGIYQNDASMAGIHEALNPKRYGLKPDYDPNRPLLIIVGGVPLKEFNLRTQFKLAKDFNVEPGRVALLPDHRMILQAKPVDHEVISGLFMFAIGDVFRRMVEMAIDYRELHPVIDPTLAVAADSVSPQDAAIEALLRNSASADEAAMKLLEFAKRNQTTSS